MQKFPAKLSKNFFTIANAELVKQLSLHKLSAKTIPTKQNLSTKDILEDFKHIHKDLHTVGIFLDYNCDGSRELLETVSLRTCNSLAKLEKECI